MDAPLEGEDKNALGNSFNAARRRGGRLAGKQNNGRRREPCAEHRRRRHRSCVGGLLFGLLGFSAHSLFANIIVSVVGACVFLFVARRLTK